MTIEIKKNNKKLLIMKKRHLHNTIVRCKRTRETEKQKDSQRHTDRIGGRNKPRKADGIEGGKRK